MDKRRIIILEKDNLAYRFWLEYYKDEPVHVSGVLINIFGYETRISNLDAHKSVQKAHDSIITHIDFLRRHGWSVEEQIEEKEAFNA